MDIDAPDAEEVRCYAVEEFLAKFEGMARKWQDVLMPFEEMKRDYFRARLELFKTRALVNALRRKLRRSEATRPRPRVVPLRKREEAQ